MGDFLQGSAQAFGDWGRGYKDPIGYQELLVKQQLAQQKADQEAAERGSALAAFSPIFQSAGGDPALLRTVPTNQLGDVVGAQQRQTGAAVTVPAAAATAAREQTKFEQEQGEKAAGKAELQKQKGFLAPDEQVAFQAALAEGKLDTAKDIIRKSRVGPLLTQFQDRSFTRDDVFNHFSGLPGMNKEKAKAATDNFLSHYSKAGESGFNQFKNFFKSGGTEFQISGQQQAPAAQRIRKATGNPTIDNEWRNRGWIVQ